MAESNQVGPLDDLVPHAAAEFAATDVDVTHTTSDGKAREPARYIVSRGAGSLIVVTGAGQTRTFTVTDGWERVLKVRTIKQGTNVALEVGY